jgi:hypothetical protein
MASEATNHTEISVAGKEGKDVTQAEVTHYADLLDIPEAEARKRLIDPRGSILADWNKPGGYQYELNKMKDAADLFKNGTGGVNIAELFNDVKNDKNVSSEDKFMFGFIAQIMSLIPHMARSIELDNLERFSKLDAKQIRKNMDVLRKHEEDDEEIKSSLGEELKTKTFSEIKQSLTDKLDQVKSAIEPGSEFPADASENAERSLQILRSLKAESQRPLTAINRSFRESYDDLWQANEDSMTPEDLSLYAFSKNFLRDAECELDDHLQPRLTISSQELESLIPQGSKNIGDVMRTTRSGEVITLELHDKNGGKRHSYFLRKRNGHYLIENASRAM